jgi:hypothetical protein
LTFSGSGTYATGFVLDATTAFADTHLVPNTTLTQDSCHYSMFNTNAASFNGGSGINGAPYMEMYFDSVAPNQRIFYAINSTGEGLYAPGSSGVTHNGHHIVSRSDASTVSYYKNGLFAASDSSASTTRPTINMFVGANNTTATPGTAGQFDGGTIQFFTIGSNITSSIATRMYNDIVNFNTALSR